MKKLLLTYAFFLLIPALALAVGSSTMSVQKPSDIKSTSATANGTITGLIGGNATVRGFAYGTLSNLSGGDTATTTENGSFTAGAYTASLTGLTFNTTYYIRSYETNPSGTVVSVIIPFKTASSIPKPANNLGLVGYWPMDEATSTKAGDFSGNGNTGTLTSGATWGNGKRGGALDLSGSTDYLSVPDSTSLDVTGSLTISVWFKASSFPNSDGCIVSKSTDTPSFAYHLCTTLDNGPRQFYLDVSTNGTTEAVRYSATTLTTDVWYHVVGVFDASAQTMTVYLNGVNDNGTTLGSPPTSIFNNGQSMKIGDRRTNADQINAFIDDVRIYNRALSASEVATLYTGGTSGAARSNASSKTLTLGTTLGTGLVGLWTFDGGDTRWTSPTAGVTYDGSGNNNIGTLTNMSRTGTPTIGKLGQALSFDGNDDRIVINDNSSLHSDDGTFSAWVRLPSSSDDDEGLYEGIISGAATDYLSIELGTNATGSLTNEIGMIQSFTGGVQDYVVGYTSATRSELFDNQWHHIAVTADTTTHIYIDGQSKTVTTGSGTDTGKFTQNASINTFRIGDTHASGSEVNFFGGLIDDARVYNRALSASEVQQLYNLGKAVIR